MLQLFRDFENTQKRLYYSCDIITNVWVDIVNVKGLQRAEGPEQEIANNTKGFRVIDFDV